MISREHPRRFLVALDLSPESTAAAELTVEFAAALGIELVGLFVEDEELLALAAHPMVRELDAWSTAWSRPDTKSVERRFRVQGARARDSLARLAQRRGIASSFLVVRGPAAVRIREASRATDIVTVGRVGWSRGERGRLGTTTRALLAATEQSVMIPGRCSRPGAPIVVVYDGSEQSRRALDIATTLAHRLKSRVRVCLVYAKEGHEPPLRKHLAERIASDELIEVADSTLAHGSSLSAQSGDSECRLLLVPRRSITDEASIATQVAELSCPVLIVT